MRSGTMQPGFIYQVWQNVIDTKNVVLLICWLAAVILVAVIIASFKGFSTQFVGLAGSREQTVSFQHPVQIVSIPVVEGEAVGFNTTLLEVRRYDLSAKLIVIDDNLSETTAKKSAAISELRNQVASLEAEKGARLADLDTRISTLEAQYELNTSVAQGINSFKPNELANPFEVKISGLKTERRLAQSALQVQINNLKQQLTDGARPEDARISELKKNKQELQRQAAALEVKAQFRGSIGSVYYKLGDQIAPFSPVLTLLGHSPNFVKGYIHEEVINDVSVGQKVWVKSLSGSYTGEPVAGVVESLGHRLVEYPERLKKNAALQVWGREAVVVIDSDNSLLLGEKVLVSLKNPESEGFRFSNVVEAPAKSIVELFGTSNAQE
ncbi:MAG: hypothetical protein ABGY96_07035 [bacterium]